MTQQAFADARDPTSLDNLLRQTKQDAHGCLLWTGGVCSAGQPIFKFGTRNLRVAREVFKAVFGAPNKKHYVIEAHCSNLRCIAPEHLRHVPHSRATRRLVGVPLPDGMSLKDAGYQLVHRTRGASIWEPEDIARAVWAAHGLRSCVVCEKYLDRNGKLVCSNKCDNERERAARRIAAGKAKPGDDVKTSDPRRAWL